jgi:thiamine-phosphate diphosphorylase/hydroxyethylthiazole kinase
MATNPNDCKDLSPVIGALLINFGYVSNPIYQALIGRTITDKDGMLVAGREANVNKKPLVFDPVAIGATSFRRQVSKGEFQGVGGAHDYRIAFTLATDCYQG